MKRISYHWRSPPREQHFELEAPHLLLPPYNVSLFRPLFPHWELLQGQSLEGNVFFRPSVLNPIKASHKLFEDSGWRMQRSTHLAATQD